jgi:hypothetical protein
LNTITFKLTPEISRLLTLLEEKVSDPLELIALYRQAHFNSIQDLKPPITNLQAAKAALVALGASFIRQRREQQQQDITPNDQSSNFTQRQIDRILVSRDVLHTLAPDEAITLFTTANQLHEVLSQYDHPTDRKITVTLELSPIVLSSICSLFLLLSPEPE